jgi:hypothetical protein
MGLFDRFRSQPERPPVTQRKIRDQPGPLTSHEAWAFAGARAQELDPEAALLFVASGLDISPAGRSFTWEFSFELPGRGGQAFLTVGAPDDPPDLDSAPVVLVERFVSSASPAQRAQLPHSFRDSPEVVEELSQAGVDFVAGPTDMKLEGRVLPSGEAVWLTYYWDDERTVSFTPTSTGS